MRFDGLLELVVGILVVVLLIAINFKVFISPKTALFKIIVLILTLLFSLPAWYLIQDVVIFILANTTPESKIVNCIYLSEANCEKRHDCQLSYPVGGLGKEIKPLCGYK